MRHLQQLPYKSPVLRKQEQKVPFLNGSVPYRQADTVVPHVAHHGRRLGKVKSGMEKLDAIGVLGCSAKQQTNIG